MDRIKDAFSTSHTSDLWKMMKNSMAVASFCRLDEYCEYLIITFLLLPPDL